MKTETTIQETSSQDQALNFLKATGTEFKAVYLNYGCHFEDDKKTNTYRDIYKVTLKNNKGSYSFKFGQSISNTGKTAPTEYDVLACVTKYDPYDFESFCGDFGYDEDSRSAERIYKAVCKEWENIDRLFTSDELELLQEIQ